VRGRALAVVLAITIAACGSDDAGTTAATASTTSTPGASGGGESANVDPAAGDWLAGATNQLGFDLLYELDDGGNVLVSPASVAMVLAMLLNGANGETFDALARTLHVDGRDEPAVNAAMAALQALAREAGDSEIDVASSLWADGSVPLTPSYLDRVRATFGATLEVADLGAAETADAMDAWVRAETRDVIDGIAGELGVPDAALVLVLLNAVHFSGTWTTAFDPADTGDGTFTMADGSAVAVPMMRRNGDISRARGDGFELARLPYGADQRFVMDLVLPAGPLAELRFDAEQWASAVADLEPAPTELTMPRLDVGYTTPDGRLDEVLTSLGMGIAYSPESDFTRLSEADPFLSKVVHKTRLVADEKGTEAGAVTGGGMRSGAPEPFTVDRPLLLTISDTETGVILFVGTVADPRR
jgi:serine protease inhibitor